MTARGAKMPNMRTTIRIDDELYREVKAKAARSGRTVAAVLEDAVRRGLNPSEQRASRRYVVRPMGRGGLRPGVDLSSNAAVAEAMDEGASVDALR
jgi:predicted DNA-binding protein